MTQRLPLFCATGIDYIHDLRAGFPDLWLLGRFGVSLIYPIHDDQDDAHTEHERIKERKQNRADLLLRSLELLGIMDAATQGRDLFFF